MENNPGTGIAQQARGAALLFLLLIAALRLSVVWISPPEILAASTPDDAYYYFGISRSVAMGAGSTFDGITPTNGYHPLWMMIGAATATLMDIKTAAVGPALHFARVMLALQILIATSAIVWLGSFLGKITRSPLISTVVYTAGCTPYLAYALADGMESGLVLLFLALFVFALFRFRPLSEKATEKDLAFGAVLALGLMARLDLALVSLAVGIVTLGLWSAGRLPVDGKLPPRDLGWLAKKGAAWSIPVLATLFLYLVINSLHFDSAVPISGKLKNDFPDPSLSSGAWRDHPLPVLAGFLAIICGVLAARSPLRPLEEKALALFGTAFVTLHLANTLLFMDWGVHAWHFTTYWVFAAIHFGLCLDGFLRPRRVQWKLNGAVLAAACLIGAAGSAFIWTRAFARTDHAFQLRSYKAALWAREELPGGRLLGMSDCGAFGYFHGGLVVNLDGVVNNEAYQKALAAEGLRSYLMEKGVGYIAHHAVETENVEPGYDEYEYSAYSHLYGKPGGSITLEEVDEVYRSPVYNDGTGEKVFIIWKYPRELRRRDFHI